MDDQDLNHDVLPKTVFIPKLVVAIDFGTCNSGYAYQHRIDYENDRTTTIYLSKWLTPKMDTHKIPTCILLKPDQSIASFGSEAQIQFANLEHEENKDYVKWFFFSFFKMMLYRRQDLSEKTPLESAYGATLPAIVVFSKAIEYMKDHFINSLKTSGLMYEESETLWVLTVPAIWNDQAKQFMRKAAEKAGILRERLVLALEPEAAAIFCSQIPITQMEIQGNDGKVKHFAVPGSTIMVVDLGGGTVDATTVKIEVDGTIKQVNEANGDDSGGMKINEKFTLLMQTITGPSVWNEFASNFKQDELEFQMDFELKKRILGMDNGQKKLIITIPLTLTRILEKQCGMSVEKHLSLLDHLREKVTISQDKLIFDVSLLIEFFQEPVLGILEKVRDIHQKYSYDRRVDALILVGGFAQSNLVIKRVRDGLANLHIPVVRLPLPEVAVLKGAVLFGHNPEIITSRVLSCTYGVGMNVDFESGKYDEKYKFEALDENFYAMNVFKKHAERGQDVKLNEWTTPVDYCVDERGQMNTDVCIYTSKNKDAKYTDECSFLGKLSVDFSNNGLPRLDTRRSKSIEVSLCFAGTELNVKAVDKNTKRKYEASLEMF